MKLIADSGSTKTDWRLLNDTGKQFDYSSEGINPYFHTAATIAKTLDEIDFSPFTHLDLTEVFFYSAGSSNTQNVKIMNEGFAKVFTNAKIYIYHDLLGAARALFHDESGIACILGTGSNSCLFINGEIKHNLGGQGYILGDEGSGMHIGRKVVRDFMNDLMPEEIRKLFIDQYSLSKDQISFTVYKKRFPNRFLASFSRFVLNNLGNPYFDALADDAFMKFFERYIIHYDNYQSYPMRLVGSIGYHFRPMIEKKAAHYGITVDKVIKTPIDGLVDFHR